MKNLSFIKKSDFFLFHRVYGIQNDRLDLTIILADAKTETVHNPSQRQWLFFKFILYFVLHIFHEKAHGFLIRFGTNENDIKLVVLNVNDFSMKEIDFFKSMTIFTNGECPIELRETMYIVEPHWHFVPIIYIFWWQLP